MLSILADTNLWLRSVESTSDQHAIAVEAIRILATESDLVLAPQILVEFWAVATRPVDARGLNWTVQQTAARLSELRSRYRLLADESSLFDEWYRLVEQHQITGKRVHDARIAACLIVNGIDYVATFNSADFAKLPVKTISPEEIVKRTIFGKPNPS